MRSFYILLLTGNIPNSVPCAKIVLNKTLKKKSGNDYEKTKLCTSE